MAQKHLDEWEELLRSGKKFLRSEDPWNWTPITKADDITPAEDKELITRDLTNVQDILAREMAEKEAQQEADRNAIEDEAKRKEAQAQAQKEQEEKIKKWRLSEIDEIQKQFKKGKITNESRVAAITAITQAGMPAQRSEDVLYPNANDAPRSTVSQILDPLGGAIVSTIAGAPGNLASLGGGAIEQFTPFNGVGQDLQEYGVKSGEAIDVLQANTMAAQPGENSFVTNLSSGAGSLVSSLALAYAGGPVLAAGTFGVNAGGGQFRAAEEAGKDTGDALTTGLAAGTAEAALEKIGLDKFLGASGSLVKKTLTRSITEGVQEATQSLGQSIISASYKDIDIGQAIGEAVIEGGYGAIVGGGGGFALSLGEKLQARGMSPEDSMTAAMAVEEKIAPVVDEEIRKEIPEPKKVDAPNPEAEIEGYVKKLVKGKIAIGEVPEQYRKEVTKRRYADTEGVVPKAARETPVTPPVEPTPTSVEETVYKAPAIESTDMGVNANGWDGESVKAEIARRQKANPNHTFKAVKIPNKNKADIYSIKSTPTEVKKPVEKTGNTDSRGKARQLIEGYVKRGDTVQQLKAGQLGSAGGGVQASIGGYVDGKKVSSDNIIVTKDGKTEIFKLKEIYDEIASESKPTAPTRPKGSLKPIKKPTSDLQPTPLEQEAIKHGSSKELAKSLYDRVQNFDKTLKLSKEQKDDLHQYVQFKMQDRANKPPKWVEEAFNNAQSKNTKRIEAQSAPQVGKTEKPKGSMKPIKKAKKEEPKPTVDKRYSGDKLAELEDRLEQLENKKDEIDDVDSEEFQELDLKIGDIQEQMEVINGDIDQDYHVTEYRKYVRENVSFIMEKDPNILREVEALREEAENSVNGTELEGEVDDLPASKLLDELQELNPEYTLDDYIRESNDQQIEREVGDNTGRVRSTPSGLSYLRTSETNDKPLSKGRRVSKSPEDLINLADQLNKAGQANAILRKSGLRKRDAAGVFSSNKKKPGEEYIALKDKSIKDPEQYFMVLGHELSHAIEFTVNGDTISTYKMFGDLTAEEKSTIESELKAIVDNIETKKVAEKKPGYYYKPTEMMARFVETLLIDKAINQKLAPTVTDKFYELASRSQPVQDLLDAVEMKLDKGFIQKTPSWFKDVRQIHVTKLGKRAGEQAYNALIVKRAQEQKAISDVEKLMKSKWKDIKDSPQNIFRAIESIKVTKDGIPTFGTHDFNDAITDKEARDLKKDGWTFTSINYRDGKKVRVYSRPRYTPEESKRIFDRLSPEGQKLVKDFTAAKEDAQDNFNREIMKDIYEIESNMEGWIHRGIQKAEPLKKTRITVQKATLRKKQAGFAMKRKGGENYLEDARKQIAKALVDGELTRINNEFISDQLARVSKPLAKGSKPDPGWTEVVADKRGLRLPGEGLRMMVEKDGGIITLRQQRYQVPTKVVELYRDVRQVSEDASQATKAIDILGKYWAINVLIHPATFGGTTAITNAMQYGGKVTRDFYIEVLTGDVKFPKTRRNLIAPFVMFPGGKGWNSVPEYVFGGHRSSFAGQFVSENNFESKTNQALDQFGNKALIVMSKLDSYFKKMIAYTEGGNFAELEKRGVMEKLHKEEAQLIAEVNQVIDRYMLDYDNKAPWIDKFDRFGGKLIKPFITFGYKISKANAKYVTDAFDPTLTWQERTASLLTISTIVGAIYAKLNDLEDEAETPAGDEDTPYQFKPGGRIFSGIVVNGQELYVRVSKYPFFALTAFGKNVVEGNYQQSMDLILEQYGTLGPGADIFNIIMQNKNKFDTYKPTQAMLGELLATFVPGFRMTGDIGRMMDTNEDGKVVSRKPTTFFQGLAGASLPAWGDEETRRRMRGDKRTVEVPIVDTDESRTVNSKSRAYEEIDATREKADLMRAFITGIYVNRIDPNEAKKFEIYALRKQAEQEVLDALRKKDENRAKEIAKEHGLIIKDSSFDYYRRQ